MSPKTMRAVVKDRPAPGASLQEIPLPQLQPDQVLVRVEAASICGTDLHIYQWDGWAARRIRPPLVFGHEVSGYVVQRGAAVTNHLPEGALVSAETHLHCGHCYQCRTGQGHVCRNMTILGVDVAGTFAEYVAIPAANAWVNPPGIDPAVAAVQEPLGNAVHAVSAADVAGRTVLVTGCGPIGVMSIAVARAFGARKIIASEPVEFRRRMALRMGAHRIVDPTDEDLMAVVEAETEGEGVDVLLEMSGHPRALEEGLKATKPAGFAALLGLTPADLRLDLTNLVILRGLTLYGVAGRRMFDTWYRARALLESGAVDLGSLVTHHYPLAEFEEAFATVASGQSGKVVLLPPGS